MSAADDSLETGNLVHAGPAAAMAREAGALLRQHYQRGVVTEYKGEVDLVTVADRESEKLLVERLHARWPDYGILGEEGTRKHMECEYRWYIDPLDGTTNFAHGFPAFCVSMGLEHRRPGTPTDADGELVAAVIYDPLRDEMFLAEKGRGAYLNGRRIHVSSTATMAESLIATGFPSRKRHGNPNVHFYHEVTLRSHGVRRAGSAALDLAYTACGRLDGYWEFKLNPWDTAAGVLLVREAGGTVTYIDGSPFRLESAEVLASNGIIHASLIHLFEDMFAGRDLEPIPTPREFAAMRKDDKVSTQVR
jgi:myo-inositol-1(or 4)-monophosphatase